MSCAWVVTGVSQAAHGGFSDWVAPMMTAPDITGVWRLLFCDTEFKDSGERVPLLGADPIGFLVLTPGGRMMVVLTASEMTTPTDEASRAQAFRNTVAYTGTYRLDNNRWVTDVEVSWHPAWKGTQQIRNFEVEEDRLSVMMEWAPSITFKGHVVRSLIEFEKHSGL